MTSAADIKQEKKKKEAEVQPDMDLRENPENRKMKTFNLEPEKKINDKKWVWRTETNMTVCMINVQECWMCWTPREAKRPEDRLSESRLV